MSAGAAVAARVVEPLAPVLAAAVLRWRARWLRPRLTDRTEQGLRLLPILLHGSFQNPALKSEAPGVRGVRFRPGWGALSRCFDLPPPFRLQRGRPLIEALIALPTREGALVLAACAAMDAVEEARLRERLAVAQRLLAGAGAGVRIEVLASTSAAHSPLVHRALAFGAVIAGRLPANLLKPGEGCTLSHDDLRALLDDAPTPLSSVALLASTRAAAACPADVLGQPGRQLPSAATLADPDLFCLEWLASDESVAAELRASLRAGAGSDFARQKFERRGRAPLELGVLLAAGRTLAIESLRGARRLRRGLADPLYLRLCREVVVAGVPRAVLPALTALAPSPARLAGLLCGRTIDASALDVVAPRLTEPPLQPTLALFIEATAAPGPPFDPLNRGAARVCAIGPGLCLRRSPGRRPTARTRPALACVALAITDAGAGRAVEIIPRTPEALVAASRLSRAVALARPRPGPTAAIEAGGSVLLAGPIGLRSYPLRAFARRPRVCTPDPESPDLSLWPENLGKPRSSFGAAVLECRVEMSSDSMASVVTADSSGALLREEVPLEALEEHLQDSQTLLRAASPPRVLAIRCGAGLEAALRRRGAPSPRIDLALSGALPFSLEVELLGIRYSGRAAFGWSTAAAAVLALVPAGQNARVRVKSVEIIVGGAKAPAMMVLYARSLTLRRLRMLMARLQSAS